MKSRVCDVPVEGCADLGVNIELSGVHTGLRCARIDGFLRGEGAEEMKLYVWGDVRPPAYGADTLVVLVNNLRQARKLAKNAIDFGYGRGHSER